MADKELHQSTSHEVSSQETPKHQAAGAGTHGLLNASGHVQELNRNFSLWSLAGVGLSVGNVWPAIGGSILVAIYNGGPPGTYRLGSAGYPLWLALTPHRRAIRVHHCFSLLLVRGRVNCRARFCHPILSRCLSMGVSNTRQAMGSFRWFLRRLLELAGMDLRCRLHDLHPGSLPPITLIYHR